MSNRIEYYDKSLAKYVLIDRKTGFSSYQSVDEFRQQNSTSKQLFRHNSEDKRKEFQVIDDSNQNYSKKKRIHSQNVDNGLKEVFNGDAGDELLCKDSSTQSKPNNRLLEGFGPTSDMRINSSIKVDKCLLSDGRLRVIGQMDRKLIVCLATDRNLLLAFDQHAVHERIRYETLLNQFYDNKRNVRTVPVLPPIAIALDSHHLVRDFDSYQKSIKTLIGYELQSHPSNECDRRNRKYYSVTRVPQCLSDASDCESIDEIIKEAIVVIEESKDVKTYRLTPKVVERLQMKACKGAIRFGDVLKLHDCLKLMKSLSNCKNCFRCAHGRSSVAPLIYLPNGSDDFHQKEC